MQVHMQVLQAAVAVLSETMCIELQLFGVRVIAVMLGGAT